MFCVACYMIEIVPAIIAKNFDELEKKIKLIEPYACPEPGRGINWVQLDVMDGKFAPEKTGYQPEDLKKLDTKANLEVHLMIERPEKEIDRWINSGAKRILVHVEAIREDLRVKIYELRKKCDEKGVGLGVALKLETPIDVADDFIEFLNHKSSFVIQLMSIAQIGYHGYPFDEKVIPKIRALKERYPNVKRAVDGGINKETAKMALAPR